MIRIFEKLIDIYVFIFFLFVLLTNIVITIMTGINILYFILPVMLAFIFIYSTENIQKFGLLLFLFTFFTKLVMVIFVETPPISDYKVMVEAAELFSKNDFSYNQWQYYSLWPYQAGFTVYQGLIFKIFGVVPSLLRILNCFWIAGTTLLIYKISQSIFDEKTARISGIIYALYVPTFLMAPVLNNQNLSIFFFTLSLWFYYRKFKNQFLKPCMVGLALAIGNIFRPVGIVFLISLFLIIILEMFYSSEPIKKKLIVQAKKVILTFSIYFGVTIIVSAAFKATGVSPDGLSNNNPYWKFVIGLNPTTNGTYSEADYKLVYTDTPKEKMFDVEKELIKERISNVSTLPKLFMSKVVRMWSDYETTVFTFHHVENASIFISGRTLEYKNILYELLRYEKAFYILLIGGLLYMIATSRKNGDKLSIYYLYSIVSLYTFIHLIIEASPRYKYDIMAIVIILSAKGISQWIYKIDKYKNTFIQPYKER